MKLFETKTNRNSYIRPFSKDKIAYSFWYIQNEYYFRFLFHVRLIQKIAVLELCFFFKINAFIYLNFCVKFKL